MQSARDAIVLADGAGHAIAWNPAARPGLSAPALLRYPASPTMTPADAARTILTQIPRAFSPATLEDYGLQLSPEQARRVTREALALSLFWVRSALDLALKAATGATVLAELRRAIEQEWRTGFGQREEDAAAFFREAEARRAAYERIMREGAPPMMIAGEAAGLLVDVGAVSPEDRTKALALLVDVIPVDEIGELIADLDVTEG